MKIKLQLSNAKRIQVTEMLKRMGVEITEDSDLILTEEGYHGGELYCKDDKDIVIIPLSDVLYIESLGKDVFVHTNKKRFTTETRIYVLEQKLPSDQFVRISNSVIIRRDSIMRIRPTLTQKYNLTLKNGDIVDVTRTYYCLGY
jgi:two-component system response regulator LytT